VNYVSEQISDLDQQKIEGSRYSHLEGPLYAGDVNQRKRKNSKKIEITGDLILENYNPKVPLNRETEISISLDVSNFLGRGSHAKVYQVQYNGKTVAAKKFFSENEFITEAKILSKCSSSSVISLWGIFQEKKGLGVLLIESMSKGSLRDLLQDKLQDLPWSLRWHLCVDISTGLAYIHSLGIIHRDIKSQNILLDHELKAKLCDFGISKMENEACSESDLKCGTTRWRAPETFSRTYKPHFSQDVFSFGMVMWEIGSRAVPWDFEANLFVIEDMIQRSWFEEIPSDWPLDFSRLIERCRGDQQHRPTAIQLQDEISKTRPKIY